MSLLSIAQINENLLKLNDWELEGSGKCIIKILKFGEFNDAINFINKIKEAAEQEKHYPDLKIFNSNNLEIKLTTYSTDASEGLTQKDFDLAKKIDEIL